MYYTVTVKLSPLIIKLVFFFIGRLRAINPENGFFGVAPGTSAKTNPNALHTVEKNTIFTNVGETSDGGVYWEGLDQDLPPGVTVTSWLGKAWQKGEINALLLLYLNCFLTLLDCVT